MKKNVYFLRFRALGKRVFYVTNNSTKHRREYKDKVDKLGFGGDLEDIIGKSKSKKGIFFKGSKFIFTEHIFDMKQG